MGKVLVIGAGGVSSVTIHKMAQLKDQFKEIILASRTIQNCKKIKNKIKSKFNIDIKIEELDADNVSETSNIISKYNPELVINLALPYQDLNIMEACLNKNVHYLDTANYEPRDEAKFEYKWQWDLREKFVEKGLMALLGSGFDPGVTNVYTSYINKHYFDEINYLDILDCNGGEHGQHFATNFNPEINIREITQESKFFENGKWINGIPLSEKKEFDFPEIGKKNMYLMYHEELESLVKNFKTIKKARFWMTFGDSYLNHLNVLQNIGLTSIKPIKFKNTEIIPLEFLKEVLPDPSSLGKNTKGKTCIGTIVTGLKDNKTKTIYCYNVCDHKKCFEEVESQAVSYTTGVPAMIGSLLMLKKIWFKPGVWNLEQFDPDPFIKYLNLYGLPNKIIELDEPLDF
ncbi:MAG: saccharopine dehydrogenase [SAR116 cluster bacterium]|nr:saccharopine dehydrogenase [SAR116 cluster bacterium]RPH07887.1 MAG: saccharopine dehydrogenase family protein [Alphaproteobacteria bacterium TMED54]